MKRVMSIFTLFSLLAVLCFLPGCGYKLGLTGMDKPYKNIYCYTVVNETRKPGLEMPMTNAIIDAFHHYGGSIKIVTNKEEADAFMLVKLTSFVRSPARFDDADFLEESSVSLYAELFLYPYDLDPRESDIQQNALVKPIYHVNFAESATYFLEPNQPEGERSILPQLYDKISREIVSLVVERW